MGAILPTCAVSGLPVFGECNALVIAQDASGRWQPFSLSGSCSVDDIGEDESALWLDSDAHIGLNTLAELFFPDADFPDTELLDAAMHGPALEGPNGLKLCVAFVEPTIFGALIDAARNRLPKSTGELLELALPRKGPRSRWERPEQYEMDFVRFGAAMRVLPFSFLPFGSLGEPTRGEALPPDVQKAFDEARRRFAGHEVLLAAVEQVCTQWTEKEYDDDDEEPAVPLRIKRSIVGTFTVELDAESAKSLAAALSSGATEWEKLRFQPRDALEIPDTVMREVSAGIYVVEIEETARAALVTELAALREWSADDGSVCFKPRAA